MEHGVTDDLDRRLRDARPATGETPIDEALLASLRTQPIARRTTLPRRATVPVAAAGATVLATTVVMLAGAPGGGGGPATASAITQALRWFDPPAGTTLHARSVATQGGQTEVRELWQSADDPADERFAYRDGRTAYERGPDGFYDPSDNTIYHGDPTVAPSGKPGADAPSNPRLGELPAGDPIVIKVRTLLQRGDVHVRGRERHAGVDAWALALDEGLERSVWTLWVSADDGRPLELYDPGRGDGEAPQTIRWTAYDLGGDVQTLAQAHPDARVVDDPEAIRTAAQRLQPELR